MIFTHLQEFRQTLYEDLGNGRDALFDVMDAVLVSALVQTKEPAGCGFYQIYVGMPQGSWFSHRQPQT